MASKHRDTANPNSTASSPEGSPSNMMRPHTSASFASKALDRTEQDQGAEEDDREDDALDEDDDEDDAEEEEEEEDEEEGDDADRRMPARPTPIHKDHRKHRFLAVDAEDGENAEHTEDMPQRRGADYYRRYNAPPALVPEERQWRRHWQRPGETQGYRRDYA
uniref:Uncharacterized protein n=1 Tax=Lotharella oceanica TaxID=641309 RepID=A0A7S2TSR7_9EUKA|eukprot:CAMPEP_0170186768 /NCGR_PEP_ID=MMETSP0040_2-20121228/40130_1 /TAXON_ID=641309 /ORGANISM="Lotharella oceanica, Strain CCMP622" /LENGTH=162 /DNA_ID=CAMNT_0010433629 /DNA_START=58 /DNA_END=546 /DNA_ORIENTATION=-